MAEQQPVHFCIRAGGIPLPGGIFLPQIQQRCMICRDSVSYHR